MTSVAQAGFSSGFGDGGPKCQIDKVKLMDFHGGLVMFLHGERPKHSSIWLNWHHGEPFEICGHDVNPHDIVLYEVGSDHWHAIIGLDSAAEESEGGLCRVQAAFHKHPR